MRNRPRSFEPSRTSLPERLLAALVLAGLCTAACATDTPRRHEAPSMQNGSSGHGFPVIEWRRYTVKHGERAHFATYFDTYFPEAFEQLGAIVFGQFTERDDPDRFTWLRGFRDLDARPVVNAAFYYGPVWKARRERVNAILPDSDDVMLLRPLDDDAGVVLLPVVDPVTEPDGARGVAVAQIFAVKRGQARAFAAAAAPAFERYRAAGAHATGVLVSLDVPNNFPQLPIRTDGPFVVWLGVLEDDRARRRLDPVMREALPSLAAGGLLRGTPERVVLDPTPRSRLRWLDGGDRAAQP